MNAPTTKSALQSLDYHSTATVLASELQHTSRSAQLIADELARAERIVKILIKYMPASQMIHARLEIDEGAMQAPSLAIPAVHRAGADGDRATWSTRQWAEYVGGWEDKASQVCFGSWMAVHAMLLQFQAMTVRELAAGGTAAALDVLKERRRQVEDEDWTMDQDDAHENGELAEAAMCYADPAAHCQLGIPQQWPWVGEWWKPRDRRRNLVRAGALIIAEIERVDRAETAPPQEE